MKKDIYFTGKKIILSEYRGGTGSGKVRYGKMIIRKRVTVLIDKLSFKVSLIIVSTNPFQTYAEIIELFGKAVHDNNKSASKRLPLNAEVTQKPPKIQL